MAHFYKLKLFGENMENLLKICHGDDTIPKMNTLF